MPLATYLASTAVSRLNGTESRSNAALQTIPMERSTTTVNTLLRYTFDSDVALPAEGRDIEYGLHTDHGSIGLHT
jgi:hypothetical protein